MQAVLSAIKEQEPNLNCYVTVDEEGALKRATQVQEEIDAGRLQGPLAGVPVAIKDNMCTKDMLTTCSSKILYNFIPTFSSEAVLNLEKAGAVIIGDFLFRSNEESMESQSCTGRFLGRQCSGSCCERVLFCTRL